MDERLLPSEPRIEVIEIQRCPGGQIDEFPPLRREFGVAAERRNEFVAEGQHLPRRHRSHVDRSQSSELDLSLDGVQAVSGIGSRGLHEVLRKARSSCTSGLSELVMKRPRARISIPLFCRQRPLRGAEGTPQQGDYVTIIYIIPCGVNVGLVSAASKTLVLRLGTRAHRSGWEWARPTSLNMCLSSSGSARDPDRRARPVAGLGRTGPFAWRLWERPPRPWSPLVPFMSTMRRDTNLFERAASI